MENLDQDFRYGLLGSCKYTLDCVLLGHSNSIFVQIAPTRARNGPFPALLDESEHPNCFYAERFLRPLYILSCLFVGLLAAPKARELFRGSGMPVIPTLRKG